MTEAAEAERKADKRKWQREHPEKVKEYQAKYWAKKAAAAAEQAATVSKEPIANGGK